MIKFPVVVIAAASASFLATGGHSVFLRAGKYVEASVSPSCRIKGNISMNGGERIYHLPGQVFYEETRIRPEFGERWFCTGTDARAAGWRKARR